MSAYFNQQMQLQPRLNWQWLAEEVKKNILPKENDNPLSQTFSDEFPRFLHQKGYLQGITPSIYGGLGLSVQDLAWMLRHVAYGSAGESATIIGNLLGYSAVVLYGSHHLKELVCSKYLHEYSLWSFAMTEAEVGSDLKNTQTVAKKVSGGYLINGEKNFITNASHSKQVCVFAQTEIDGKKMGVSCFYLPSIAGGIERGPEMDKIGWRKANTATLYFKDVFVPDEYLLGEVGFGLKILTHCLNRSKTLLGAVGVGISDRALDLTVERLAKTNRYGKALLDQPVLKHLIAKLQTKKEAAWLLTLKAAMTWDENQPAVTEASMAKYFSGKVSVEVTSECMELFGARGGFNNFEISRLINDAKLVEIVEGPSLVQELLISSGLMQQWNKKQESDFTLRESDLTLKNVS